MELCGTGDCHGLLCSNDVVHPTKHNPRIRTTSVASHILKFSGRSSWVVSFMLQPIYCPAKTLLSSAAHDTLRLVPVCCHPVDMLCYDWCLYAVIQWTCYATTGACMLSSSGHDTLRLEPVCCPQHRRN
jgi:hypothetical protein